MAKKVQKRSFKDVLAALGNQRFDVAAAGEGANHRAVAMRVSKYGVAAEIADYVNYITPVTAATARAETHAAERRDGPKR